MTLPGWQAMLDKQSLTKPTEGETKQDYVAKYDAVDIQVYRQQDSCADPEILSLPQFNRNDTVCVSSVPQIEYHLERAMPSSSDKSAHFHVSTTGSSRCFTPQQAEREKSVLHFVFLLNERVLKGTTPLAEAVRKKLSAGILQNRDPTAAATYVKGPGRFVKSSGEEATSNTPE